MSFNPLKPFTKGGANPFTAINNLTNRLNELSREVDKITNIEQRLEQVEKLPAKVEKFADIEGKVNDLQKIPNEITDLTKKIENLPEELKDIAEEAVSTIIKEAQKTLLKKGVKFLKILAPDSMSLTIGFFTFTLDGVVDRIRVIESVANNPPASKDELLDVIKKLSPDSVTMSVSGELALVFVSSSSLSVGLSGTWTKEKFLKDANKILKEVF